MSPVDLEETCLKHEWLEHADLGWANLEHAKGQLAVGCSLLMTGLGYAEEEQEKGSGAMVYECWWDKQYGDKYAIRIDNDHVTGWHKLAPDEKVTTDTLPWIFYQTDPENVAWCESIRSKSEILLSVEVR